MEGVLPTKGDARQRFGSEALPRRAFFYNLLRATERFRGTLLGELDRGIEQSQWAPHHLSQSYTSISSVTYHSDPIP